MSSRFSLLHKLTGYPALLHTHCRDCRRHFSLVSLCHFPCQHFHATPTGLGKRSRWRTDLRVARDFQKQPSGRGRQSIHPRMIASWRGCESALSGLAHAVQTNAAPRDQQKFRARSSWTTQCHVTQERREEEMIGDQGIHLPYTEEERERERDR